MAYSSEDFLKNFTDPGGSLIEWATGAPVANPGGNAVRKVTGRQEATDPLGFLGRKWEDFKNEVVPSIDDKALKDYAAGLADTAGTAQGYVDPSVTAPAGAGLIQSYQDTIAGRNPSVAMNALRAATQQNTANVLGNAGLNTSGANSLLALRTALAQTGLQNQQAAGQASGLRAQEIAAAQSGLANQLAQNMQAQELAKQLAVQALAAPLDAEAKNAAAKSQFWGGLFQTGGNVLGEAIKAGGSGGGGGGGGGLGALMALA